MAFEARIEADSISPDGVRLTTFVVTFPRIVLAEVNTHRMLSRNSASSRAVPVEKRIAAVEADPFVPASFGKNQRGMQAREVLTDLEAESARVAWMEARDAALYHARSLATLCVHKQLANRLLEPFAWHTAVITATDWKNFFALRCHPDAQPEFQTAAHMMRDLYEFSTPRPLSYGSWHLPFLGNGEHHLPEARALSVARCARVSALTHDGVRDPAKDLELYERLRAARPVHASPFEHVATPDRKFTCKQAIHLRLVEDNGGVEEPWMRQVLYCANFRGWLQLRHTIANESVPG